MPSGSRLPLAIVLLVVLGMLVAAPAAGAAASSGSGDDTLGGTLDSDSSSTDSGSDSTDTNVTDSETSLSSSSSDSTSSSDSSSSDSTSTSESDSTQSSSDSSGSSTSDGSSDGTDESSGDSVDDVANLYEIDLGDGLEAIGGSAGELSVGSLDAAGEGAGSAGALKLDDVRTLDRVSRLEVEATAGTADTLDADGTITDLTGLTALSTVGLAVTDDPAPPAAVASPARATGRETGFAPATSNLQLSGEGADGGIPAPGPTGGVALGIGAVAAAGVARQWGSTPALLSGLGATVASVAPATSRWGPLDRLVRTIAPFRYSRYDDSDPLEHEARESVFELVQQSPGAYLSEVSDGADLPLSTARHHVRVLEQEDLVTGAKVRGKRRFYPAYTEGIELTAAMNDESTATILDAIARLGASSVSDLAGELEKDPSTISHHLQRLEGDDLIVRERDGRAVLNRLSADARTAIEPDRQPVEAVSESIRAGGAD